MPTSVWLDRSECEFEGGLPPVCMKCGEPADATVRKKFSWYPPWTVVLILAGLLIWVIVAMVLTKRMTVHVPLCDRHRGFFTRRTLISCLFAAAALSSLFGGIGLAAALSKPGVRDDLSGYGVLAGVVVMVVFLIAAVIMSNSGIKPAEITDRDIRLKGVDEEFVAALKDQRREERAEREERRQRRDAEDERSGERRSSRRRDEEEDDDDDRRPRRRRED